MFFIDDNARVACFDTGITDYLIQELAGHKSLRIVFRDTGFVSDSTKINIGQIFHHLPTTTNAKSI